jgi:hypothetical protein
MAVSRLVTWRELSGVTLVHVDDELTPRLAHVGDHEGDGGGSSSSWVGWW